MNGTEGYKIQFQQAYQMDSQNRELPGTTISLPSFTWEFSSFVQENGTQVDGKMTDVVRFNITSTDAPAKTDTKFQFRVAINAVTKYIKFDTLIQSVDWRSDATQFVLCYKLLTDQKKQERDVTGSTFITSNDEESKLLFGGGGFVSVKSYATSGANSNTPVSLSTQGSGGSNFVCVQYAKWTVDPLVHDPSIGFDTTATSWLWLLIPVGLGVGGVVCILIAAAVIGAIAVFAMVKKTKPQYSAF